MTVTTLRERAGSALLHAGTDLAFDQAALERGLATTPGGTPGYGSALGAVALARRVDDALLWLGWRILPSATARAARVDRSA